MWIVKVYLLPNYVAIIAALDELDGIIDHIEVFKAKEVKFYQIDVLEIVFGVLRY